MAATRITGWACLPMVLAAAWLAGCAALDELSVAQTQRLEEGEFYAYVGDGVRRQVDPAELVPVTLDLELATSLGYGQRAAGFAPIVSAMNAALQAMACCSYIAAPAEAREQVLPHDRVPPMVMHVRKPSAEWSRAMADLLPGEGEQYAVVVRLAVTQYPKGREGVFGKKVVLGTGYDERIEFLTAEDKLLEVLQLTGALVDAQGRVVRAGAEGILARDTPFAAQVSDVSQVLDDRTLERAGGGAVRRAQRPAPPRRAQCTSSR